MAYVDSIHRPAKTLTEREQKALFRVTGEHRAGSCAIATRRPRRSRLAR